MILNVMCEIKKNVAYTDPDNGKKYTAVSGINILKLVDDDGNDVAENTSKVLWAGSGSPYPTPPGGPWETKYFDHHPRFGKSFQVLTPLESDVMLHRANELSYGCFIVSPGSAGDEFFNLLVKNRAGLYVTQSVNDVRSVADMDANPIDYEKIGRIG